MNQVNEKRLKKLLTSGKNKKKIHWEFPLPSQCANLVQMQLRFIGSQWLELDNLFLFFIYILLDYGVFS